MLRIVKDTKTTSSTRKLASWCDGQRRSVMSRWTWLYQPLRLARLARLGHDFLNLARKRCTQPSCADSSAKVGAKSAWGSHSWHPDPARLRVLHRPQPGDELPVLVEEPPGRVWPTQYTACVQGEGRGEGFGVWSLGFSAILVEEPPGRV